MVTASVFSRFVVNVVPHLSVGLIALAMPGCTTEEPLPVLNLGAELSPDSNRAIRFATEIGVSPVYVSSTSSDDTEILPSRLASIVRETRDREPAYVVCHAEKEGPWVFYIGHSLAEHRVVLELSSNTPIYINDSEYDGPISLAPGAHGFRVTRYDASTRVEYISLARDNKATDTSDE
jgi:hypothetical protein